MSAGWGRHSPSASTQYQGGTGTTPSSAWINSNSRSRLVSTTDSGGSIRSTIGVDWRRSPAGPFHSLSNATWLLDAPPLSQPTRDIGKSQPYLREILRRGPALHRARRYGEKPGPGASPILLG